MSKVKIQGHASGTGVLTITAPNTSTDRTITLPDGTGTLIADDGSGNVGIGVVPKSTHADADVLQIGGTAFFANWEDAETYVGENVYLSTSGAYKYLTTSQASLHNQTSGKHVFQVAPSGTADAVISWTSAMTIDNSGNVDIGGSGDPATVGNMTRIMPNGRVVVAQDGSPSLKLYRQDNDGGNLAIFHYNTTVVGSIDVAASSTSYNTSSDYRLKENVVPMTGSIDRLKELKPSRFNFKIDADITVDGFLAHEAQEVVPEAISGTKDAMMTEEYEVTPAVLDDDENIVTEAVMGEREVPDMQGIDQSKLVPLLVAALQEAITRIEQLENA